MGNGLGLRGMTNPRKIKAIAGKQRVVLGVSYRLLHGFESCRGHFNRRRKPLESHRFTASVLSGSFSSQKDRSPVGGSEREQSGRREPLTGTQ
jgi:hypothetical protein